VLPPIANLASCAGTLIVNDPDVAAIWMGPPTNALNEAPPLIDFATRRVCPPASGQKTKTSPNELVLTSPPSAVKDVSIPLTWVGTCQVPAGPTRTDTQHWALRCQTAYMLSRKGDDGTRSTHNRGLSVDVCAPETTESKVHV
jgi:hypothetical protein